MTFAPTFASVDLTALVHNLAQFRRRLTPGCEVMAIVKANAYGHGAVETTIALMRGGVTRVAVVSVDEGIALRRAGIRIPIVVLGPLFREQLTDLLAHQLTPVVSDMALLAPLAQAATSVEAPYPVHLKVDTGMGRLGLSSDDLERFLATPFPRSLHLEGVMTHLADTDGESSATTEQQLALFNDGLDRLKRAGYRIPFIHAANSGGAVRFPQAHYSLVRPGIMLYGYHTLPAGIAVPRLQPVLSLHSRVAQLKTIPAGRAVSYNGTFTARRSTRVAVLPIGYADGISRRLSNVGQVLIRGRRAPIIGLVCMDMVMVDVTAIPNVTVGDDVVLIGQQGHDRITAHDVAVWAGTIPYEILCGIGPRVPRVYSPT